MAKSAKCLTPREALERLKVAPGGRGGSEPLCAGLRIGMFEAPRDSGHFFELTLERGNRRHSIALTRDDVVTKGKSTWKRDNLWRLRPEAVERFEKQLLAVLEKAPK